MKPARASTWIPIVGLSLGFGLALFLIAVALLS